MPNKQNAKKALRQAKKRTEANLIVKKSFKKAVKEVMAGGEDATTKMRLAQQQLDKAAKKGVIKKNTASRKLSRLMKRVSNEGKKK